RDVVAGPLRAVPPHPLLPLAPRPALGVGGCTVIEDAAIGRPRPAPRKLSARRVRRVRLLAGGEVLIAGREHAAVDPGRARGGPVVLEIAESGEMSARVVGLVSVDLLQDLQRVG